MRGSRRLKAPVEVRVVNLDPLVGNDGKTFFYDDLVTLAAGGRLEEVGRCGFHKLLMYVAPDPLVADPPSGVLIYVHEMDVPLIADGKYPLRHGLVPCETKDYAELPSELRRRRPIRVPRHREVMYWERTATLELGGNFYRTERMATHGTRLGFGHVRYGGQVRVVGHRPGDRFASVVYVAWPEGDPRVDDPKHCPRYAYAEVTIDELLAWDAEYALRSNAEKIEKRQIRALLSEYF
jgi:hypothetical protein